MTYSDPPMSDVAHAIGEASIRWADIEFVLHDLCVNLARFQDQGLATAEAADVLDVMLSLMDARQRIAAAKVLAATGLDPDLYGEAERLLNYIDNDLRNERNRFIHDSWEAKDGKIVRTKYGARVLKPQSRTIEVQHKTDREYSSVGEVREFAEAVTSTLKRLMRFDDDLGELYRSIWPPEGSAELTGGG